MRPRIKKIEILDMELPPMKFRDSDGPCFAPWEGFRGFWPGFAGPSQVPQFLRFYGETRLSLNPPITRHFSLPTVRPTKACIGALPAVRGARAPTAVLSFIPVCKAKAAGFCLSCLSTVAYKCSGEDEGFINGCRPFLVRKECHPDFLAISG
jgi:hypothetical protein